MERYSVENEVSSKEWVVEVKICSKNKIVLRVKKCLFKSEHEELLRYMELKSENIRK